MLLIAGGELFAAKSNVDKYFNHRLEIATSFGNFLGRPASIPMSHVPMEHKVFHVTGRLFLLYKISLEAQPQTSDPEHRLLHCFRTFRIWRTADFFSTWLLGATGL